MHGSISEPDIMAIIRERCDSTTVCNGLTVTEWRNGRRSIFQVETGLATKWRWTLIALCVLLLSISAVATGLFLSICGTNLIGLLVSSTTESRKQRFKAPAIMRFSRHRNWLICSLVIIIAACNVTVTELLRIMLGKEAQIWETIVASTFIIALLGKLLPQRIATASLPWNRYCYPLIWCAMLLTAPVSWVLGKILDKRQVPGNNGAYTHQQLNVLIKYHNRLERRGGDVGPDAVRVMRSALDLDGVTVSGGQLNYANQDLISDVESCERKRLHTIVAWPLVRTVGINDEVDREFVKKIKSWPYSRIPVVSKSNADQNATPREGSPENRLAVYGFLHIKDLLDLQFEDFHGEPKPKLVEDLPLYPLPVVREDMLVYEILNMFQLGMSRMALVVPTSSDHNNIPRTPIRKYASPQSHFRSPWAKREHGQRTSRFADEQNTWTMDFLQAAQESLNEPSSGSGPTVAIRVPRPLGIVTHADIINALLRSPGIDEKAFFGSKSTKPPKKQNVRVDESTPRGTLNMNPLQIRRSRIVYSHNSLEDIHGGNLNGTLRRRRGVSGQVDITDSTYGGFDGANERGLGTLNDRDLIHRRQLKQNLAKKYGEYSTSSYTQNSDGGFHATADNRETLSEATSSPNIEASRKLQEPHPNSMPARTVSMPTAGVTSTLNTTLLCRRVTGGFSRPPGVQRVSEQSLHKLEIKEKHPTSTDNLCAQTPSNKENYQGSLSSASDHIGKADRQICIPDEVSSRKTAIEMEGHSKTHNWYPEIPAYSSMSMPRLQDSTSIDSDNAEATPTETAQATLYRDDSFQDDRSFLPSQRKPYRSDERSGEVRRTSFWW